jgi:Putative zinc-finger
MHATDQQLAAYLSGELDRDAARGIDEHLLECEDCWAGVCAAQLGRRAAERVREPAPPALADRIRLAVELAPAAAAPRQSRRGRWLAVAAGTVALIAATVTAALVAPHNSARHDPAVITALVRLAAQPAPVPPALSHSAGSPSCYTTTGSRGAPPWSRSPPSRSQHPRAHSHRPGSAMAWTITRDTVTVYCPHSEVILAPDPSPPAPSPPSPSACISADAVGRPDPASVSGCQTRPVPSEARRARKGWRHDRTIRTRLDTIHPMLERNAGIGGLLGGTRLLLPGGRLGITDVTVEGPLPGELTGLAGWVACIADARRLNGYARPLGDAACT